MTTRRAKPERRRVRRTSRGAILLEVVLALTIFLVAAGVILNGLSASVRGARQLRQDATASDLAVTVLSRLETGITPLQSAGPSPFEEPDRQGWTWQVVTATDASSDASSTGVTTVEVIIKSEGGDVTRRLGAWIADRTAAAAPDNSTTLEATPAAPTTPAAPVDRGAEP